MAGIRANIVLTISALLTSTAVAGNVPNFAADIEKRMQLEPGTASTGQADLMYAATRNIAASGNDALDLAGSLIGPLGGAAETMAEVVAIYVEAAGTNVNNVVIGGGANPFVGPLGAAGTLTLKPGEFVFLQSQVGWPVTAATADILRVANSGAGTGVDYTIIVLGRSVLA